MSPSLHQAAQAQPLNVVYPPLTHQTASDRIFFIGTANASAPVTINGEVITQRSPSGHFAPTLPLAMGENSFAISALGTTQTFTVTRVPPAAPQPTGLSFAANTLFPSRDIARLPGELVCFEAVAPGEAEVTVTLANQQVPLEPTQTLNLPPNYAVLTDQTDPFMAAPTYAGCVTFAQPGNYGTPEFQLSIGGQQVSQTGEGAISILSPIDFQLAEVTAVSGVARTGPSTNHSRLTPLPQGTQATITGREGEWLRLDYGGWIKERETRVFSSPVPNRTTIRGIRSAQGDDWTDVIFPLQTPVPVSLDQDTQTLTLTLHNTTAETDTIFFSDNPVIERMDWRPILPDTAEYTFHYKTDQQWGYRLRYEDTNLILSLRHGPPREAALQGTKIVLDPGHGGDELGARGPDGTPEKAVNLIVSQLLQQELEARGATVLMTRERDEFVSLRDRMDFIAEAEPTLALSIHYNALPDNGDAINTAGIGMFWYHPQAHDLAVFLHNYLVETLDRPEYGVFWNNLALTRPHAAPTVLLELGFMINPFEYEWISDPTEQQQLAMALANGVEQWLNEQR
ncbi:MAG: N-acetylmuramoyl-L-alanine amidase [Cyanobacteria bacterium P01_A01_bin.105]